MFHEFWTGKSMMHFWEIREEFAKPSGDNDRTVGQLLPLEDLIMDYASIGKIIKHNEPNKNLYYNVFCRRCKQNMTKDTLEQMEMNFCVLAIIEKALSWVAETGFRFG